MGGLDPGLPDYDIQTFTYRYTELIRSYGADIIKVDDWGLKRLAYLVKKREKGVKAIDDGLESILMAFISGEPSNV